MYCDMLCTVICNVLVYSKSWDIMYYPKFQAGIPCTIPRHVLVYSKVRLGFGPLVVIGVTLRNAGLFGNLYNFRARVEHCSDRSLLRVVYIPHHDHARKKKTKE